MFINKIKNKNNLFFFYQIYYCRISLIFKIFIYKIKIIYFFLYQIYYCRI